VNILRALPYPSRYSGNDYQHHCCLVDTRLGSGIINKSSRKPQERYRVRQTLSTIVVISTFSLICVLWAKLLQHTGTFLGILGAGLAIALREPLLPIAGRFAIFTGHMFNVGDRIEINRMSGGDVTPIFERQLTCTHKR
jgi:hypothetical protein